MSTALWFFIMDLAIWLRAKNMAKWGIPEKSIKNVAQRYWPYVRRSLQSKVMAQNWFLEIPLFPDLLSIGITNLNLTIAIANFDCQEHKSLIIIINRGWTIGHKSKPAKGQNENMSA